MNINFLLVNYNNTDHTIAALQSISKFIENVSQILIVDNNSNDANLKKLQDLKYSFQKTEIIYSSINTGYFGGLNLGLKHLSTSKHSELTIIGNNDLIFPEDFHNQLKKSIDMSLLKYPVVSPRITTINGEQQNPHVINRITKFREMVYDIYYSNYYLAKIIIKLAKITQKYTGRKDEEQYFKSQEIYMGYGACYILTPLFFDIFQELWAPTFLMYEEFFLSKQLSDKGFKIYYESSIHVTHALHSSTGTLPRKQIWEIARESHREYRKYVNFFNFKK
jgi:GT2 family glycosyltransferase